jgi:hypothetical protein
MYALQMSLVRTSANHHYRDIWLLQAGPSIRDLLLKNKSERLYLMEIPRHKTQKINKIKIEIKTLCVLLFF